MAANSKRAPTPASWKPGQSGNPTGRKPDAELQAARKSRAELAGPHADKAMQRLADIAENGASESAVVAACQAILDSTYGKLSQGLEHSGPGGKPLEPLALTVRFVKPEEPKEGK